MSSPCSVQANHTNKTPNNCEDLPQPPSAPQTQTQNNADQDTIKKNFWHLIQGIFQHKNSSMNMVTPAPQIASLTESEPLSRREQKELDAVGEIWMGGNTQDSSSSDGVEEIWTGGSDSTSENTTDNSSDDIIP